MATIGKNILDNLTTGMYSDSKVIYREYIQNACDQIDLAVKLGITNKEEASVDIFIDANKRYICIEDNATGVESSCFISDLGDIANSNKVIGENKGFRGIGRLCGLGYCRTVKFTTSYKGEAKASIMICDAKKMREMLIEKKKYTVDEIWEAIVKFEVIEEDIEKHYFKVELIDINRENTDLLDSKKVRDYLSFAAPVPYKTSFYHLANKIYAYSEKIGYTIDEYCVTVNGSQIFKEYTTKLKVKSGNALKNYDEITELEFQDFRDSDGSLLAWMWIGLSRFETFIPKINQMRGLRLRSGNIQLGNDDRLKELFKETRGNYYFVGEVFAVSKFLIPNSQRDYFNENETRVKFEDELRTYFYDVLQKIYTVANRIKNAHKRQEELISKASEYEMKSKENGFVDEDEKQRLQYDIEKAKKSAEDARRLLRKFENIEDSSPISVVSKSIGRKFDSDALTKKAENTAIPDKENQDKKKSYITSNMSKLSRSERKLVSRILSIITDNAPKEVAEQIIEKIKEELK
jgi:hypothetical protein